MNALERRVLLAVDAGFGHALAVTKLRARATAARLAARGLLRVLPARGRWPERYVVTNRGIWALGTFEAADLYPRRIAA